MKQVFIVGFILMVVAQWYAPASMIINANKTIDDGVEYKFRTRPVDPSDPFRGKSIILIYDAAQYHTDDSTQTQFPDYSAVNAVLGTDSAGFAKIERLTTDTPIDEDYVTAQFQYAYESLVMLGFEFDQFYLEESKASEAERLYWQTRTDSSMICYAKVKVFNGDAKLVDVILNDSSIVDVVRRINAGKAD